MKTLIVNSLIFAILVSGLTQFSAANPDRTDSNKYPSANRNEKTILSGLFRAQARKVSTHEVYMKAGTIVKVTLLGDAYTELDLYVYDSKGNLVISSTRAGDIELADLVIYRSGYFRIKVANHGIVYNDYLIEATES